MSSSKRLRLFKTRDNGQGPSNNPGQQQATGSSNQYLAPPASSSATTSNVTLDGQASNLHTPQQVPFRSTTAEATSAPATPPRAVRGAGRVGWAALNGLFEVLGKSTGVCAPLTEIVEELIELIDVYERAGNGSDEYEDLQNELEDLFGDLSQHLSISVPQTMTTSMENFCRGIKKELDGIRSMHVKRQKGQDGRRQNVETAHTSDEVLACYRRIQKYFHRLTLNADLSMWKLVDEHVANTHLDRLSPVMASLYDSDESLNVKRGRCTEGTRVEVLANMHTWVYTSPAGAVYWLNGMAGTGKTTIAYSLCEGLETARRLGASFFCSRLLPECRSVSKIVPSIAYQLARFSRPFQCALLQVLSKEPDIHKRALRKQFETLIVKPLAEVQATLPTDLVVVIDALDECDNKDSTRQILDLLLTKSWTLPIKFFVCSRPEPQIRDEMTLQGGMRASARLVLHELDKGTVQADIGTYLREALRPMQPSELQLSGLVERAGVLFIYAATAVRYIGYDNFRKNPHIRLETILKATRASESNKDKEIDELYTMILKAAMDDPDLERSDREDMKLVLNTVICAREPLTTGALSGLLKLHDTGRVHSALRPLWSVLHVMETSELVATLHASFPDYMLDSRRSRAYHCDERAHNHTLAHFCFDCIAGTKPQFNICGLESSCMQDKEVENLDERVEQAISIELFYACRFWAAHLSYAEASERLITQLERFLSRRFLLWMEILNLHKSIHVGADIIWRSEEWSVRQKCSPGITELAHDAWRFVMTFASSLAAQSTPHIYVSMLAFWPSSTPIAKHYMPRTHGMIQPRGAALTNRRLAVLNTWPFDAEVQSAAFSPDGTQIALAAGKRVHLLDAFTSQPAIDPFGGHTDTITSIDFSSTGTRIVSSSNDKTIRVWDPQTGQLAIDPIQGHTSKVTCVRFSPDSTRIASGSDDRTIRMWDAQNGQAMLGPFEGHTSWITSVAFSSSGTQIVSGSSDKTIRVWDIQSRQTVLELKGHTSRITSALFSPDGNRIISASYDKTIRLWSAQDGKKIGGLLKGHTGRVTCVAFSADGSRIVSGSEDTTTRIWDPESGKTVLGPLEAHTETINSVAFSTRGSHIVSSSSDRSVVLWDARSKQGGIALPESHRRSPDSAQVCDAPSEQAKSDSRQGHTAAVLLVRFSPDGTRIVSGSDERTIRVWDVQSGQTVLGPRALEGHTGAVKSVQFSPDGTRIICGSGDKTIRVWDVQSGQTVIGPLEGHTGWITSVQFSPDGTRIVSGSYDKTIRVWDVQSGQTVLGPLEGHTGWTTSVQFSPDGTRIVSGSYDKTIRVWDVQSGQTVIGPLEGHTNEVISVQFSPDGTRIVSGSGDKTIRVWDVQSGQTVIGPLEGHTDWVASVQFSPDGTRIVSGSGDKTIRVWDVQSGQTVLGPLEGHANCVTSVQFSPDGTRIASGSYDRTIRVWDVARVYFNKLRSLQASSTLPSNSTSSPLLLWEINKDGWIVDKDSQLLVWVPRDLQDALEPAGVVLRLQPGTHDPLYLSFDNALLGESWTGCYQPA